MMFINTKAYQIKQIIEYAHLLQIRCILCTINVYQNNAIFLFNINHKDFKNMSTLNLKLNSLTYQPAFL